MLAGRTVSGVGDDVSGVSPPWPPPHTRPSRLQGAMRGALEAALTAAKAGMGAAPSNADSPALTQGQAINGHSPTAAARA